MHLFQSLKTLHVKLAHMPSIRFPVRLENKKLAEAPHGARVEFFIIVSIPIHFYLPNPSSETGRVT